jgi:hypothetical protein
MAELDMCFWNNRNLFWNDDRNLTWNECVFVNDLATAIDGGAPDGKKKRKYVRKKIKELTTEEKETFIKIKCKILGKEYEEEKKVNKKLSITVEDVKFVLKEAINVDIRLH